MGVKSLNGQKSSYLFSDFNASLADGEFIESGWIPMEQFNKYQFEGKSDALGMRMTITSSRLDGGAPDDVVTSRIVENTFHLFNVIARGRFMKFKWENESGSTITNCSLSLKVFVGSSDQLSVLPLSTGPTNFSQAALVQSVIKGQQPDGDYVNTPADGSAFTNLTPLLSDGVFLSDWVDTDGWNNIELFIGTDQLSAEQGIEIEFTDDVQEVSPIVRAVNKYTFGKSELKRGFIVIKNSPKLDGFRVRYTNGDIAQTSFFINTSLRVNAETGEKNLANALLVSDFNTEIALGNVNNYEIGTKFGRNPDIDIGQIEDMWNGGGDYTGQPTGFTPETVTVSSNNANDTSAGTGARTIRIFGLESDSSTSYTSEDITLNGLTGVVSSKTWWRINRAYVLTAGTLGQNAGVINVESSATSANVFVQLPVGFNQSTIGAYTVPAGKTMLIKRVRVAITRSNGSAGSATISLRVREPGGVYRAIRVFELQTGATTEFTSLGGSVITPGSDIKYRVDDVSDSNTIAEGAFEYILIDN